MMWERDGTSLMALPAIPDITGLEEDSSYTITVTATNAAGSAPSYCVTKEEEEEEAGKQCALCTTVHICSHYAGA